MYCLKCGKQLPDKVDPITGEFFFAVEMQDTGGDSHRTRPLIRMAFGQGPHGIRPQVGTSNQV